MPIGFFQFDNLIRGRIPFLLFATGYSFEGWYGLEAMHLKQVHRPVEQLAELLPELKKNLEQPIIFACENGVESKAAGEKLEALGFKNVYYLLGGWRELEQERSAHRF